MSKRKPTTAHSGPREVTFAYGRVSTGEQTAENQRLEIEAAGHRIDAWFADEGVSGSTPAAQRPEFQRLLASMRAHLGTGMQVTLVTTRLDRLGRDAVDVLSTIRALGDEGIRIRVLQLGGGADLASPTGRLLLGVVAAVAEMERELIRERTKAGLARTKAAGQRLGRPPKTSPADRASIRQRLAAGESVSQLAREFNVARSTVTSIRDAA